MKMVMAMIVITVSSNDKNDNGNSLYNNGDNTNIHDGDGFNDINHSMHVFEPKTRKSLYPDFATPLEAELRLYNEAVTTSGRTPFAQ
jgi:hypothetical protein